MAGKNNKKTRKRFVNSMALEIYGLARVDHGDPILDSIMGTFVKELRRRLKGDDAPKIKKDNDALIDAVLEALRFSLLDPGDADSLIYELADHDEITMTTENVFELCRRYLPQCEEFWVETELDDYDSFDTLIGSFAWRILYGRYLTAHNELSECLGRVMRRDYMGKLVNTAVDTTYGR